MSGIVPATADDPVVRGLAEFVGGPPGRHTVARSRTFWAPERVVLALAMVVLALAWVEKAPCRDHAWANQFQYTHVCYTDVYALYFAEGLADGKLPYLDHPVEYPVLTGAAMEIAAVPARLVHRAAARAFFDITAVVLAVGGLLTVWAVGRLPRRRPWDAAMVAAAPLLLFTAYVNWDLIAVALASLALLAWARSRPVLAGVLLGLAVAAKLYPLLFFGPLFVLCLRAGRLRAFAATLAAAATTWLVVDVPVVLLAPAAWQRFFSLSATRGADWGTFWYWLQQVRHRPLGSSLNLAVAVSLLVACGLVALLGLSARHRPRLAQLAFLTVAAFLLTGKVWSQQYVLWLVPLAVLARPRWRGFLLWQAGELAYLFAFYYELVGAARSRPVIPEWLFLTAAGLRAGTLLVLCGLVVVDILVPEHDVVRRGAAPDPLGGVLTGAPDRLALTPALAPRFATVPAGLLGGLPGGLPGLARFDRHPASACGDAPKMAG